MSQNYTLCEIKERNGENGNSLWIVIKGVVYDVTNFINEHPGGDEAIREFAGKDATKAFNQIGHSADAIRRMKLLKIGNVASECTPHLKSELSNKSQNQTKNTVITIPPGPTATTTTITTVEPNKQCCGNPKNKTEKLFCCC